MRGPLANHVHVCAGVVLFLHTSGSGSPTACCFAQDPRIAAPEEYCQAQVWARNFGKIRLVCDEDLKKGCVYIYI